MIRKLLILNFTIWVTTVLLICQTPNIDTTIYTPRGIAIAADYFIGDDYTFYEADSIDNDYVVANPKAILIGSVTRKYNCHGYAWHKIEGGIDVWVYALYDTAYYGFGIFPYFG